MAKKGKKEASQNPSEGVPLEGTNKDIEKKWEYRKTPDYTRGVRKTMSIKGTIREFKVKGYINRHGEKRPSPVDKILNVYAYSKWDYDPEKSFKLDTHKDIIRGKHSADARAWEKTAVWRMLEQGADKENLPPVQHRARKLKRKKHHRRH